MTRSVLFRGLLVLATLPCAAEAQVELRGRLVTSSGAPIPGATITVGDIGYRVQADSGGWFALAGQRGATLLLRFSAPGFRGDSASVVLGRQSERREFTLRAGGAPAPEVNPSATTVRGRVVDAGGVPLSYANVQFRGGRRMVADDSGRFQFPYTADGAASLLVRRIGFEPAEVTLPARPDTALRVVLAAIPMQLKAVTVTASSAFRSLDTYGFYARMRDAERGINHGYFITPEDIDQRKPYATTQMADGFPTVRVRRSPFNAMKDVIVGSRDCRMTVYLDNVRITGRLSGNDDYVNELIPPGDLAAMEIYPRSVGAPPQYQALNGTCGVVLVWTK